MPAARVLPSGANSRHQTALARWSNLNRGWAVATSQTVTQKLLSPVAKVAPSGENAIDKMSPAPLTRSESALPVNGSISSHHHDSGCAGGLLLKPTASRLPSGENRTSLAHPSGLE